MHAAHNPFILYHPAVTLAYLVCVAVFTMAVPQPVYVALSCAGAAACSICVHGVRAGIRRAAWMVPLIAIVALANMLFVSEGTTVLFTLAGRAFTLEGLLYGICSGGMLAAMMLWITSCVACVDSADIIELAGRTAPTIALMVTTVMRLIPQLVRRGRAVEATLAATPAAAPRTARERTSAHLRTTSVLMGWSLEESLVRADTMRARGYACGAARTAYRRHRIRRADIVMLVTIALLAALCAPTAAIAVSQYSFYPHPPQLVAWWGYAPYVALVLVPVILSVRWWRICRQMC